SAARKTRRSRSRADVELSSMANRPASQTFPRSLPSFSTFLFFLDCDDVAALRILIVETGNLPAIIDSPNSGAAFAWTDDGHIDTAVPKKPVDVARFIPIETHHLTCVIDRSCRGPNRARRSQDRKAVLIQQETVSVEFLIEEPTDDFITVIDAIGDRANRSRK